MLRHGRTLRRMIAGAVTIGAGLALASCGSASSSTDQGTGTEAASAPAGATTLRVAYAPTAAFLPAFVAEKRGFFKQNKLAVTLTPVQNLSTTIPTLGRQFDLSGGTPVDVITAQAGGLHVVAVSGNTVETSQQQQMALMAGGSAGIHDLKQLTGKRIGTPSTSGATHLATLNALKGAGVDPATVRWIEIPFPAMADQLKAGNVTAVESVQPFVGALTKAGATAIGDPLLTISNPAPFTIWLASRSWATAHATALKEWRRSLDEAAGYIARHPAASRRILEEVTHLPAAVVQNVPLPRYDTDLTSADLAGWLRVVKDVSTLKGSVDPGDLVAP